MKNVTQDFKDNIKKYGRQLDAIITVADSVIESDNINGIHHSFNTTLFKTVMNVLEIDSNVKIEKGSEIDVKIGVAFDSNDYEYINFNNYVVTNEPEKQEDTLSYKVLAYDKMVESMIDYDLNITRKITLRDYLIQICQRLNWNIDNIPTNFINSNKLVLPALHSKIGYTFRDALDEIATISCSFLCFEGNDFFLKYATETDEIITEEYLSADDVTIGEEYFINSVVFARAEESDNIYRKNNESIAKNGLHEYRISDNQLLSTNERDLYIDEMFGYLSTFRYYVCDIKSTGILIFDVSDRATFNIHDNNYSTIILNNEINITQGLDERIYSDSPEETETDYKYADLTDRKLNQTYILVDKQNQTIESVVNTVSEQNNKISKITQTVDEINSKISDIADITTSQETNTGKLVFDSINQSEPIHIEIRPLGENISYLYPNPNLFPHENLYLKTRTLQFKNTKTDEVLRYELPDDLLYYDEDNWDSFILDYDSQTCFVNKKCRYDAEGNVQLLENEVIEEFEFPHLQLTDGDYTIEVLTYSCYLQVRLMAQNIYTTQFATTAKLNSDIKQTINSIDLSVDKKLTNYSTTTQMNSAITLNANSITSAVSETYQTKSDAKTQYSEIKQTVNEVSIDVGKKYNSSDFTNAKITAKINDGTSNVQISASKISLAGKEINLSSDNTVIKSNNFNVDRNGNMTCANATITGGNLKINAGTSSNPNFLIGSSNERGCWIIPEQISLLRGSNERFEVHASNEGGIFLELFSLSKNCYTNINLLNNGGRVDFGVNNVYCSNNIHAIHYLYDSKEEIKKDILEYKNSALNIINNSKIYEFNYKNVSNKKKTIGFVIGENYITPDEIISDDKDGINSYSVMGLLWKAVQEQQETIENMQKEIQKLKGEN